MKNFIILGLVAGLGATSAHSQSQWQSRRTGNGENWRCTVTVGSATKPFGVSVNAGGAGRLGYGDQAGRASTVRLYDPAKLLGDTSAAVKVHFVRAASVANVGRLALTSGARSFELTMYPARLANPLSGYDAAPERLVMTLSDGRTNHGGDCKRGGAMVDAPADAIRTIEGTFE